ncbi:hypothetical protein ACHWQZ_G001312 [Mnemiopsis leidyi]
MTMPSMFYFLIIPLLFYQSLCATRERVAGEITTVSVEHSATKNNEEETNRADHAIDLDLDTRSYTVPGSDGKPWLKVTLDKVNCIEQVMCWTCNDSDCRNCKGNGCSYFSLTVSTEGAVSDLSPVSDCKLGDTVKLVKNGGNEFAVSEIVAIGKEEADCLTHDSTWSNVVTVPELPVVHGTTLTLNCDTDYTNLGGNTATCLYGQVVPTNQPPDCKGTSTNCESGDTGLSPCTKIA